ncbi:MAG: folate-binding protein [Alphaproteobacteria bacterium]|nr:folate-binding protein [Alphaproteobacteria bacterium]MBU1526181.1 folate-binding protein [Alphaproteobacteria bacterium]MBU2117400.1 folate-binding protein [Alphaproteobacteria bacterium]MBU2350533.1 folate-binding protein [Alphaproteobacteria bacterium]MBU2380998.1 folate-binding protein [Alphaproteobacteria bacterium]
MTARIARLEDRAVVAVTGPDARSLMHGLVTQDVLTLVPGEVRFGAFLSPPGRLMWDLFLWGAEDGVRLDVAADRRDALIARLMMHRLRAQVTIAAEATPVFVGWDGMADGFAPDPRLGALGGRRLGEAAATATAEDFAAHRLALGVPDPDHDCGMDRTYPIEANFDLLNGIDFGKGCFVGQETTSRMKRRGTIKTRMLPIGFEGPAPVEGAEVLTAAELRAGQVLTGGPGRAMALLRLDRIDGPLTVDGRPVTVERPDYLD